MGIGLFFLYNQTIRKNILPVMEHKMKFVKYVFLIGAIAVFLLGLVNWLWKASIDYAAMYFALSAIGYAVYLHITKQDRD